MCLLWCTWHLQWQQGRRSEADLEFGSNPYDSVASPAERREYELKTGLYGETSKRNKKPFQTLHYTDFTSCSDHLHTINRFFLYEPIGGRCPQDRRSLSAQSQHCSAPPLVHGLNSNSLTLALWTRSWGRRRETLGLQSQARWCSENVKSHVSPESAGTVQSENRRTCQSRGC